MMIRKIVYRHSLYPRISDISVNVPSQVACWHGNVPQGVGIAFASLVGAFLLMVGHFAGDKKCLGGIFKYSTPEMLSLGGNSKSPQKYFLVEKEEKGGKGRWEMVGSCIVGMM